MDRIALALTLARSSPAPLLLAAIRSGLVKRSGGRFKLPLAPERASRPAPALPGKMRLTDVCNRPTTRAPCESLDSRLRLHEPCGPLRAPTRGRSHGLHLGGASLDGDPPASALDVHRVATRYPDYSGHGANEIPLGPGGCRDRRPLRRYPPAAVFSTARRADDVASDAPCRIRRSPTWLSPNRTSPDARPASTAASSKAAASTNQSAFHRRVPLRPLAQTSLETRHRLTTLPSRSGFRHPFAAPLGRD
jgi:hypothetical protein